ncbi:MAG: carbamoyltransferase N-terminal domain-containing protein [bacterium]|nr:carbamoyltransferase N-terminal domain-containing protein [bacterium]
MKSNPKVLGVSAFYHDSSLCYIEGDRVVAALQEERFSRIKNDEVFPLRSLDILKERYGFKEKELDAVVFYDKPILKFERIIENLVFASPRNFRFAFSALPLWLKEKLFLSNEIRKHIRGKYKLYYLPHHISHAASAFLPSGFDSAAYMVNDGVGEWDTTTLGRADKNNITQISSIEYPHSLGMFYSAFTYLCGFEVNSGEYKLMGLAPYGEPKYSSLIKKELIDAKDDGSYRLNMDYFEYEYGERMAGKKLEGLFNVKARKKNEKVTAEYADIAASVQQVIEEILVKMAKHLEKTTGERNLIMAGGVALNCVANAKIKKETGFERIFIQPASGDAGGAMGAALYVSSMLGGNFENPQQYSYLGTEYSEGEIEKALIELGGIYEKISDPARTGADEIEAGRVIGWFQGRMEYGPRALGNRSILGDPRDSSMQKTMNMKIKFRESFRPFAPAVLEESHGKYFEEEFFTPYMLTVSTLRENYRNIKRHVTHDFTLLQKSFTQFPAVVHADFSSRVQTVSEESNPLFYRLIKNFEEKTGCPMVINTSFNVSGQPIVESPEDAFKTFIESDVDTLIIGSFILKKEFQRRKRGDFKIERHHA